MGRPWPTRGCYVMVKYIYKYVNVYTHTHTHIYYVKGVDTVLKTWYMKILTVP